MNKVLSAVIVVSTLNATLHTGTAITLEDFVGYPFSGFSRAEPRDDGITRIPIENVDFPFLGKPFDYLQIDTNGHIDFITAQMALGSLYGFYDDFPRIARYGLAPYAFDLNLNRVGSNLFYYIYNTTNEITMIEDYIAEALNASQLYDSKFAPIWALVATYENTPFYADNTLKVTFQVILATDGCASFAIFNYDQSNDPHPDDLIRHLEDRNKDPPVIGYVADYDLVGIFFRLPKNTTVNIFNATGNSGVAGQWVLRIDQGSIYVPPDNDLLLDCLVVDVDMDLVDGFQWYRNGIPLNETENVVNTTSSRLTVKNISNLDLGRYECTYDSELIRGNNVTEADVSINFDPVSYSVMEGNLIEVFITADKNFSVEFNVTVSSPNTEDVKIEPSQVTFEPHHSRVSVNVVGLNDSLIEFMESVVLILTIESSFLQSVVAGPNNKATIQITDPPCTADTLLGRLDHETVMWPSGSSATIQCPCPLDPSLTNGIATQRLCSSGVWSDPDNFICKRFISSCNQSDAKGTTLLGIIPNLLDNGATEIRAENYQFAVNTLMLFSSRYGNDSEDAMIFFKSVDLVLNSSAALPSTVETSAFGQSVVDSVDIVAAQLPINGSLTIVQDGFTQDITKIIDTSENFIAVSESLRKSGLLSLTIPSNAFTSSSDVVRVSVATFRSAAVLFPVQDNFNNSMLATTILSVTLIGGTSGTLDPPVKMELEKNKQKLEGVEYVCAFWDNQTNAWSAEGCMLTSETSSAIVCSCSHLTVFSVFQQPGMRTFPSNPTESSNLHWTSVLSIALPIVAAAVLSVTIIVVGVVAIIMHQRKLKEDNNGRQVENIQSGENTTFTNSGMSADGDKS